MTKVLLVNPARVGFDSYNSLPLHLMYLKKALKVAANCSCEIVDINYIVNKSSKSITANARNEIVTQRRVQVENECIREISERDFDILGIGGIVPGYYFSERLVSATAKANPNAWIIVGGALGLPLKNLWFNTKVDFLVESDAEVTIVDIVNSYPDKEKTTKIPGVHSRNDKEWKGTGPKLPMNLDYIAYPDWEDIDFEYYMDFIGKWTKQLFPKGLNSQMETARMAPIVMTRGCPYNCTFCFHFNRLHRKHSIGYIIDYMVYLKQKFDVNMLQTWDDLIITDRKWFLQLCEALNKSQLGMKLFMSGGKADLIDAEMARGMKKAGVIRMSYGIESGSPAILKEMKKMATVEQNYNAVKCTMETGIFTHLNMVVGMPSESKKTLKETRNFIMRLQKEVGIKPESLAFHIASAYPGSALFDYAMDRGFVTDKRKYVIENEGVGSYTLNLCGLGEKHLLKFIEATQIEMEFGEIMKKFDAHKCMKLFFAKIPKFIVKFYFPEKIVLLLKSFLGYIRQRRGSGV